MQRHTPRGAGAHKTLLWITFLATCWYLAGPVSAQPSEVDSWHAIETRNFTIYTDAGPRRGTEIALGLERFRSVFARLAPSLELRSPAPTKILAFRDAESYAPYKTPGAGPGVLGQFLSHRDGNYLTLDAGERRLGSLTVLQHEYVHYFARHNFPGVPLWFHEGLAEYYSTFVAEGEVAHLGRPVPRHLRWLRQSGELDLDSVLSVGHGRGGTRHAADAGHFYAVSWALMHYLLSSSGERLDQTADFLLRVREGEEPLGAFEEAFDTRVSSLEEEVREYIAAGDLPQAVIPVAELGGEMTGKVRPLAPADLLYNLGDLLAHMGRLQEADHHFYLALEQDSQHAEAHAGLAFVRDLEGRWPEADLLFRDALALAPKTPLTYLLWGRHLLAGVPAVEARLMDTVGSEASGEETLEEELETQVEELVTAARQAFSRATALDHSYGEAYAMLGAAHLAGKPDPEAGIAALVRARELLPERMDVVLNLVRLELQEGRVDRGRRLVEGVLARWAPQEMVAEAREEVERMELLHAADAAFTAEDPERGLQLFDEAVSVTSDAEVRSRMEERLRQLQERFRSAEQPR